MKIALEERRIDQAQAVLSALNPQRVLERGYALVFQDGHVVDSVTKVPSSGDLVVRFHDGERNFSLPN
jgi:exodeoxyribonuclease VII large subunit